MEHNEASKNNATERYILGEMSDTERDSFEEHFFGCRECARDVQMTEIFRANVRAFFQDRAKVPVVGNSWWGPFRQQAFSIAAALLLALGSLAVYQNLVTIPRLAAVAEDFQSPRAIRFVAVSPTTRGESPISTLGTEFGEIVVAIPLAPEWDYQEYRVVFRPQCGPIAKAAPQEVSAPEKGLPLHLSVPVTGLESGTCRLSLDGFSSGVWTKDLGAFSFRINKSEE